LSYIKELTYKDLTSGKFIAYIGAYNKNTYLGIYNTEQDALLARNRAAHKIHKGFACMSEIVDVTQ